MNPHSDLSYNYRDDKLKTVQAMGYNSITEAVIDMYAVEKKSSSQIASVLEMNGSAILKRLERLDIERRPRGGANGRSFVDDLKALEDVSDKTIGWIAIELRCSTVTVRSLCKRHNIEYKRMKRGRRPIKEN